MSITYALVTRTITVVGWADEPINTVPWSLLDIYNADKGAVNGRELKASASYTTNGSMSLTRQPLPADDLAVKIKIIVTAIVGEMIFTINGTDKDGNAQSEAITLNAVQDYYSTKWFKTINTLGVVRSGFDAGESVTCKIVQDRWGEVWKQQDGNDIKFTVTAKLVIGDGTTSTSFYDYSKQLFLQGASIQITVKNNADFQLGDLLDAPNKSTGNGVQVYSVNYETIRGESGSDVFLYSFDLNGGGFDLRGSTQRLWNCKFNNTQIRGSNLDFFNGLLQNTSYGFVSVDAPLNGAFDKITATSMVVLLRPSKFSAVAITLKNVFARLCSYLVNVNFLGDIGYPDVYLVNVDSDVWNFGFPADYNKKVYRQYEFDVHAQDKNGNPLSGVSVVAEYVSPYGTAFTDTTNASGDLTGGTKTVDRSWYQQSTGNTENLKIPLKVTYRKIGYKTVVKYYSMIEKVKDIAVMQQIENKFDILEG